MNIKDVTYSDAIELVMKNNGNYAPLSLIYKNIWYYKDKTKITGLTPEMTIQEKVQRDPRFTRIGRGMYALTDFVKEIEEKELGHFEVIENEYKFVKNEEIPITEKIIEQKVRIGQQNFRAKLVAEFKSCIITGIDDNKLLIASHIKPWSHSNNSERLNSKNGILLSPLFDKLFDKEIGLITITKDKTILISSKLSEHNLKKINISKNQYLPNLDICGREEFLDYHNKYIFQG